MIFGLFGMLPCWIPGSLMGSPAEAASECAGEASGKSHRLTSTARSARNARLGALWQNAPKCAGKSSGKSVRGLPFLSLPVSGRFPLSALPCLPPECPSKPQRAL